MAVKTILFFGFFLFATIGGVFIPIWSVIGYMAIYIIGPEGQWWFKPVAHFGIRYSLTLVAAMMLGFIVNAQKLRFGQWLLVGQEKAVLCFLAMLWCMRLIQPETEVYSTVDHPTIKMVKVLIFCFLMTHIVTERRSFKKMMWVIIGSTLILGLQAYSAPRSAFLGGRLEGVGGSDFSESNVLPAFIGGALPLIGALMLQKGFKKKIFAVMTSAFAVNTIVLTRSRGALVGLALAVVAGSFWAPRSYRKPIAICILLAIIGGFNLVDQGFIDRIVTLDDKSITEESSAGGRLDTWKASLSLLKDYPFGCGPGNFKQTIGFYDARFAGRDAHSTVVRCWSELGVPGFIFFLFLIYNAIRLNQLAIKRANLLPLEYRSEIILPAYAFSVGLIAILSVGLFVTLLYNEFLWWWILFPVCLHRTIDNIQIDLMVKERNDQIGE